MIITNKRQLSDLAMAVKIVFEEQLNFPIKLSRSREATSQLIAGLNHQKLIDNLPHAISQLHIDELQSYLSHVHQRSLSADDINTLINSPVIGELILKEKELIPDHVNNGSQLILCLISLYPIDTSCEFKIEDISGCRKNIDFSTTMDALSAVMGLKIDRGVLLPASSATFGTEEVVTLLHNDIDLMLNELNAPESGNFLTYIPTTSETFFNTVNDATDESWRLNVPFGWFVGLLRVESASSIEPKYAHLPPSSTLISSFNALVSEEGTGINIGELSFVSVSESLLSNIGLDEDYFYEKDELLHPFDLGDTIHGGFSLEEHSAKGFGSPNRGLLLLKEYVDKNKQSSVHVPILESGGNNECPIGCLDFGSEIKPTLSLYNYEKLNYCDVGNMSISSHHFAGKDLHRIFSDIQCNRLQDEDESANVIFNQVRVGSGSEIPTFSSPALYNAFHELVKHWDCSSIDVSDIGLYSSTIPIFESHKAALIDDGQCDYVVVNDFQENYGDFSSVIIVSFYSGTRLIAELSYSVMLGCAENTDPVEFKLDKAIKVFADDNHIKYRWHEHTIFHPVGERDLSHYQSENGLLPVTKEKSYRDSMALIVIDVHMPVDQAYLSPCEHSPAVAFNLASKLLINNACLKGEQTPIHFDFSMIENTDRILPSGDYVEKLMIHLEEMLQSNTKHSQALYLPRQDDTSSIQRIYGAYDLAGKPIDEIQDMFSIMDTTYENSKQKVELSLEDEAIYPNRVTSVWGDPFYVTKAELPRWEAVFGELPLKVEFKLFKVCER